MEFEPIVSQEEFDARVRSRLARERVKVRAEFADYEDLRASSAESARKLDDATRQLEEMRAQAEARDRADSLREARSRVSRATGVPAELIRGEDGGKYSTRPGADLARTGPRLVQPLESILFTAM